MHLRPKQALEYLREQGHPMAEPTLYKWKRILKQRAQDRLYEVARYEFPEQHLEAIEEIKVARQEMWKQYEGSNKTTGKSQYPRENY